MQKLAAWLDVVIREYWFDSTQQFSVRSAADQFSYVRNLCRACVRVVPGGAGYLIGVSICSDSGSIC